MTISAGPMPTRTPALLVSLAAAGVCAAAVAAVFAFAPGAIRPAYVFSGACVGLLVGLTGVGGGSLMTPLLILVFGVHPASAIGTDLLYASATKAVGSGVHAAHRTVDWTLVRRLASGSVPATLLTILVLRALGLQGDKGAHPLSVTLGVLLVLTAVSLVLRPRLAALARTLPAPSPAATRRLTIGLGALLGVLITLTSVGAGALGVTVLVFLYPRMPLARIVGSDIVHAVPLTLIAGAAHWWLGSVDLALLASLLCGSMPGIICGSLLTPRVPERVLRILLAAVLVLVGVKLAA